MSGSTFNLINVCFRFVQSLANYLKTNYDSLEHNNLLKVNYQEIVETYIRLDSLDKEGLKS